MACSDSGELSCQGCIHGTLQRASLGSRCSRRARRKDVRRCHGEVILVFIDIRMRCRRRAGARRPSFQRIQCISTSTLCRAVDLRTSRSRRAGVMTDWRAAEASCLIRIALALLACEIAFVVVARKAASRGARRSQTQRLWLLPLATVSVGLRAGDSDGRCARGRFGDGGGGWKV